MRSEGQVTEKRASLRLDTMFPVLISNETFGTVRCIARNISSGGMFLQTTEPMPLGEEVRVHFVMEGGSGEIVARAQVKNHYYLSFKEGPEMRGMVGMGIKFVEFEQEGDEVFKNCLTRYKTVH